MPHRDQEGFTVRVLRDGSAVPAGVGFVVGNRHIVTCAHVVNTALGLPPRQQDRPGPGNTVRVEFPLLGDAEGTPVRNCRVATWSPPPPDGVSGADVAGLVLVGEGLPEGAAPARLADPQPHRDITVSVFGYPGEPRRVNGAWSRLHLAGAVGGGVIQLDTASSASIRAQPGYSGSPVVLVGQDGDTVLGMLVAAAPGREARDSYAIPAGRLAAAWPDVVGNVMPDQRVPEGGKRYAPHEQATEHRDPEPPPQAARTAEEAGWLRPVLRAMEADLRETLASLEKAEANDQRFRIVWGSRLIFPSSVGAVGVPTGHIWQEHRQHLARLHGRLDLYDSLQAAYSLIARLHRLISQHRYLPLGKREFAEAFTVLRNAETAVSKELDELG